jgi:hypothetical protein
MMRKETIYLQIMLVNVEKVEVSKGRNTGDTEDGSDHWVVKGSRWMEVEGLRVESYWV